jgi:hypothetical protein
MMAERTKADIREVVLRTLEHDLGVTPKALEIISAVLGGATVVKFETIPQKWVVIVREPFPTCGTGEGE